jgi:hypothetical protein
VLCGSLQIFPSNDNDMKFQAKDGMPLEIRKIKQPSTFLHESSKHKALAQGTEKNIASPVLLLVTRQILDIYNTQINASLGGTTQVLVSPATLKRSLQTRGLQQKSATPTSTGQATTRGEAEPARHIETYAFNIYGLAIEIPTD